MEVKMMPKAETIAAGVAATALLIAGDYVSKYNKNVGLAMQLCSFIPAGYAIYTFLQEKHSYYLQNYALRHLRS